MHCFSIQPVVFKKIVVFKQAVVLKQIAVAVFILVAWASAVLADEPLRLKFVAGHSVWYQSEKMLETTMDQGPLGKITTRFSHQIDFKYKVIKTDANGNGLVAVEVSRVQISMTPPLGEIIKYDTNSQEAATGMILKLALPMKALTTGPMVLTLSPTGEILALKKSPKLVEALEALPNTEMKKSVIAKENLRQLLGMDLRFSADPVVVDTTWSDSYNRVGPGPAELNIETTYIYNGKKELAGQTFHEIRFKRFFSAPPAAAGQAKISFSKQQSTGTFLFEPATGMIRSSRLKMNFNLTVDIDGRKLEQIITQKVSLKQIDKK